MAKRRDPTAASQKQIDSKFRQIADGKLEFISVQHMQTWYGRYDDAAVEKLEAAWRDFWASQTRTPRIAPKLFAVGPTRTPKGYAVGRHDKRSEWFF